ncbi:MAG: HD domain-containing protein [Gemmatimonadetes bacterium]|nr:HD domain-containing protein [Gemmatimonadota bacterium]
MSPRRTALGLLTRVVGEHLATHGYLEIRRVAEALFLNGRKMQQDLDNYAAFGHVLGTLTRTGLGLVRCDEPPDEGEWRAFLSLLVSVGNSGSLDHAVDRVRVGMAKRFIKRISVSAPGEGDVELPDEKALRETARRTYAQSVAVTRELFSGTRMGRTSNLEGVKEALQNIVDQVLDNQSSLAGLSTLKDWDEYSFRHAVNVCIFSVAVGKRLGLDRSRLYDLGMAALLYDIGMSRVPPQVIDKKGALSASEREQMEAHTYLGALTAFDLRDFGGVPYRAMVAAYEHHMKVDGSGYPRAVRPRTPSVFSRIIAVADAFDAATNTRAHVRARPADEVLKKLWESESSGFDPVIVKALISVLGIYPVGTLVILDTYELAVVVQANPEVAHIHRPIVRVISHEDGTWADDPPLVDLTESTTEGSEYRRSIIKVADPDRYGVQVADYLV